MDRYKINLSNPNRAPDLVTPYFILSPEEQTQKIKEKIISDYVRTAKARKKLADSMVQDFWT